MKDKCSGTRIWPQFSSISSISRDTWIWILRIMNWVALIWPQRNSIFLPTLVGLQTTKNQQELWRIKWESKRWKILKITFTTASDWYDLALNYAWPCFRCLMEWKWIKERDGLLEFQSQNSWRFETRFSKKIFKLIL